MSNQMQTDFQRELTACAKRVTDYLSSPPFNSRFSPADLKKAVYHYLNSGGKKLRPAILLWSCGVFGGDPDKALPAAAAVELFHTWSLVHDDIIDRDERRRGVTTVHEEFRRIAGDRYSSLSEIERSHYGSSIAILSGDVQHGWSISLLTELSRSRNVPPEITLHLVDRLDNEVLNLLVEGEILDIQYCFEPLDALTLDAIEEMLWKKTGVLYRFCAEAGALIGLNELLPEHPQVRALVEFSNRCGIAFQLQDDILGVTGDPEATGKPVGNDIREGKRTSLVYYAYENANDHEKSKIAAILGHVEASEAEIREVIAILERRGGVERTRERAHFHIEAALDLLETLPSNRYRDLLRTWAEFLISRGL